MIYAQLDVRFSDNLVLGDSGTPFSSHLENIGRVHASIPNMSGVSSLPIQSSLMRWF